MMIKYNETNVFSMARVDTSKDAAIRQSPQDVHWLRPGWNEFPKEIWEQNKNHPLVKKFLTKGKIELLAVKAQVRVKDTKGKVKTVTRILGADDKPLRLKWLDEKLAIKIVLGTLNREMLQRWLDEEQRHRVKKVLRKQIKPLLAPEGDDEDGDDFEDEDAA